MVDAVPEVTASLVHRAFQDAGLTADGRHVATAGRGAASSALASPEPDVDPTNVHVGKADAGSKGRLLVEEVGGDVSKADAGSKGRLLVEEVGGGHLASASGGDPSSQIVRSTPTLPSGSLLIGSGRGGLGAASAPLMSAVTSRVLDTSVATPGVHPESESSRGGQIADAKLGDQRLSACARGEVVPEPWKVVARLCAGVAFSRADRDEPAMRAVAELYTSEEFEQGLGLAPASSSDGGPATLPNPIRSGI